MKDLGFMESKNTHLILFSAVFLVLGFLLGRVTGHQGPRMHKGHLVAWKWATTCGCRTEKWR